MKGIYVMAVLSVATLVAALDDISPLQDCPIYGPNDLAKHLPYPGDCTKFYKCDQFQRKVEMDCPFMDNNGNRLHFNRILEVCDWPDNAGCQPGISTPSSTTSTTTVRPVNPYDCGNTGGEMIFIPHPIYCDHFYPCIDGYRQEPSVRCAQGRLFDIPSRECLPEDQVNCGARITTIGNSITTPTMTTKKVWTTCPPKGSTIKVLLPHECECDRYYECSDGERILRDCPKGLHFDYVREVCDDPAVVKCVRPIPPIYFTTPMDMFTTSSYNECTNEEEDVKYSHETNCSVYYECSNGRRSLRHCMAGLHFNAIIQACDYPEKDCDLTARTLTSSTHAYPTSTPELYQCPPKRSKKRVLLPHECSCIHYYKCFKGLRIRKRCPRGTHYDYLRQVCDYPHIVKCVRPIPPPTTEPTTVTTVTTPRPKTCPPKGSTKKVLLPHECSCEHYYECIDGLRYRRTCPPNLHFDYIRQVCDLPEIVKCVRPIPDNNAATTTTNTSCSVVPGITPTEATPPILYECPTVDGKRLVLLPHEDECHLFYYCRNGQKVLESCTQGYVFNPNLRVCDVPENVKCKTRSRSAEEIAKSSWHTCAPKGSQKRTLPHECDCTRYYSCIDGDQILQRCPADLLFDYIRGTCDKPEIVKCVRPIVELAGQIVSTNK